MVSVIIDAIKNDIEIERPLNIESLERKIAKKLGVRKKTYFDGRIEEMRQHVKIEILKSQFGDLIENACCFSVRHQGSVP